MVFSDNNDRINKCIINSERISAKMLQFLLNDGIMIIFMHYFMLFSITYNEQAFLEIDKEINATKTNYFNCSL